MGRVACIILPYFFSSVARSCNARLSRHPLVIYSKNRVVGVSPEVGNRSLEGMPVTKARGCCPNAFFLAYEDSLYREAHGRFLQVISGFSPLIEPAGEKECFFDVTGSNVRQEAERLKKCLQENGWGPALIGIGKNKLLAGLGARSLLAADPAVNREFQFIEIAPGREREFMRNLPLNMDWLMPARALKRLTDLGFNCFGELHGVALPELVKILGQDGYTVYRHCRGIDDTPLINLYPPGKIAFAINFDDGLDEQADLDRVLGKAARTLSYLLQARQKGCRFLNLELVSEQGNYQVGRLVPWGCRDEGRIREVIGILLGKLELNGPVTGMTVKASSLYEWALTEQDLFSLPGVTKGTKYTLAAVVDALDEKYPGAVRIGLDIDRREQALSFWDPWRFLGELR